MVGANVWKIQESINLFREISKTKWLDDAAIYVFFNKKDLMEEKIKFIDPVCSLPDYMGKKKKKLKNKKKFNIKKFLKGGKDPEKFLKFLQTKFISQNKIPREISVFRTCAIDTKSTSIVLKNVIESSYYYMMKHTLALKPPNPLNETPKL